MIDRFEDRDALAEFCRRDPERYAFHLGDLSDREWPHCRAFAWEEGGEIAEAALLYRGLSTPSLQLLGRRGALGDRLDELLPLLPPRFHVHSPEESLGVLGNFATLPEARGQGLARAAGARLLADEAAGLALMVLNVHESNGPARSLYARLGFREALRFREGLVALGAS